MHTSVEQFGERVATCTVCGEKKTQTIINIDASNYNARSDEYASNLVFIGDNIIQEYGEFCDDIALETYEMVNKLRTSLGLNELKWVDKMEFIRKIRSVETQILYSQACCFASILCQNTAIFTRILCIILSTMSFGYHFFKESHSPYQLLTDFGITHNNIFCNFR